MYRISFRLVHRIIFNGVFFKESFESVVIEALAKVGKKSIFRKAILGIESTKLSEILTPV